MAIIAHGESDSAGVAHDTVQRRSRELPLEIVEEIVTLAWKATSDASDRQDLYSLLKAAHPGVGEVIDHVVTRFVILESPGLAKPSDGEFYGDILDKIERAHHTAVDQGHPELPCTVAERFRGAHARLDAERMLNENQNQLQRGREVLYPIMHAVTSVTLGSSYTRTLAGIATQDVYRLLGSLPHLTHLHLDFDEDQYKFDSRAYVYLPQRTPIALPSLTFLRTRTCPGCGLASASMHAPECLRAAFAQMFPKLRELQLSAPQFLKYLDAPPTLESVTICAPPTMKLFCSIQNYNVAAGLRRWMEPRPEEARDRSRRVRLKKIVVRTGGDEPIGWQQAQDACNRFGVRLIREVFYV